MGDAEKLILGIIAAIVVLVLGFFVIRSVFPKKTNTTPTVSNQITPTPTPSLINATPTPTAQGSVSGGSAQSAAEQPAGTSGYQVIQSQSSSGSSDNQNNQSQSQSGSGQTQTQTLPNGMTQTQSQ